MNLNKITTVSKALVNLLYVLLAAFFVGGALFGGIGDDGRSVAVFIVISLVGYLFGSLAWQYWERHHLQSVLI